MPVHPKYYDQRGNSCSVNGTPLIDFSDGEAIRVAPVSDTASVTEGLDGAVVNLQNANAYTLEVDLKETSVSNQFLNGLLTSQKSGAFLDLSSTVITGAGAIHSLTGGAISKPAPVSTGGVAVGKRTWQLIFTKAEGDR